VSQHRVLDLQHLAALGAWHQAEQAPDQQVDQGHDHGAGTLPDGTGQEANRSSGTLQAKAPRRAEGRRVEKIVHIEDKSNHPLGRDEGHRSTLRRAGAIGLLTVSVDGQRLFRELPRVRTHRTRDASGRYRWYNDYSLPEEQGGGTITVRLYGNAGDKERGLNRTENVRPIPPSDPDFDTLYARRNDAESINRGLDDSLYLGRAHSRGQLRQQVELLANALVVNSVAVSQHRRRRAAARAA
jgi:hypothetical protein